MQDSDSSNLAGCKRKNYEWINGTKEFPILNNGKLMDTPVFYPTEEEFSSFYAYAQKLDRCFHFLISFIPRIHSKALTEYCDRLVGHIGVCKVVPPAGWKARADDVYTLENSSERLDNECIIKRPIQ